MVLPGVLLSLEEGGKMREREREGEFPRMPPPLTGLLC